MAQLCIIEDKVTKFSHNGRKVWRRKCGLGCIFALGHGILDKVPPQGTLLAAVFVHYASHSRSVRIFYFSNVAEL